MSSQIKLRHKARADENRSTLWRHDVSVPPTKLSHD